MASTSKNEGFNSSQICKLVGKSGDFAIKGKTPRRRRKNQICDDFFESDENRSESIGGFFARGDETCCSHVWIGTNNELDVYHPSTVLPGQRIAWWRFSRDSKINCATSFYLSQKYSGLIVGVTRSSSHFICYFDVTSSRVLSAIEIPFAPICIETIFDGDNRELTETKQRLHPSLKGWNQICAVGTQQGHVLLMNLEIGSREMESDLESPSHCTFVTFDHNLQHSQHPCIDLIGFLHTDHGFLWQEDGYSTTIPLDLAAVTAVKYCPTSSILFIGFQFGGFIVYSLLSGKPLWAVMTEATDGPLQYFSVQEPENDPKATLYLWTAFGRSQNKSDSSQSVLLLYSLYFENKTVHPILGPFYKDLERCNIIFSWFLDDCQEILVCRTLSIPIKGKSDDSSLTKDLIANAYDTGLCYFVWQTESAILKCALFDLNAWYRALFPQQPNIRPNTGLCSFLSYFQMDSTSIQSDFFLDFCIQPRFVRRFTNCLESQDVFYFPSSISLRASVLCVDFINTDARLQGIQDQTLDLLDEKIVDCFVRPETIKDALWITGLHPNACIEMHEKLQESILLVLIQNGRISPLTILLKHCFDNKVSWIRNDWLWSNVQNTKNKFDEIAAPLFDCSGLCKSTLVICQHYRMMLEKLSILHRHYVAMVDQDSEELQCRQNAIECVCLYTEMVLTFVDGQILPETVGLRHLLEQIDNSVSRRRLVAKKRGQTLFIDRLVSDVISKDNQERDFSSDSCDLYPPKSILELLSVYLLDLKSSKEKHAIVAYFLLDWADANNELKKDEVEEICERFGMRYLDLSSLTPAIWKFIKANWFIDCGVQEKMDEYNVWRLKFDMPFVPSVFNQHLCTEPISKQEILRKDNNEKIYKLNVAFASCLNEMERNCIVKRAIDEEMLEFLVSGFWTLTKEQETMVKDALMSIRQGDELWNLYLMRKHRYSEVTLHKTTSVNLSKRGSALKKWIDTIRKFVPDFESKTDVIESTKKPLVFDKFPERKKLVVQKSKVQISTLDPSKEKQLPTVPPSPLNRPDPPTPAFVKIGTKRGFHLSTVPEFGMDFEEPSTLPKKARTQRELMGIELHEKMHRRLSTGRFEDIKSLLQTPPVVRRRSSFRETLHSLQPPLSILKSRTKEREVLDKIDEAEPMTPSAKQLRFDLPDSPEDKEESDAVATKDTLVFPKTSGRSPTISPSVSPLARKTSENDVFVDASVNFASPMSMSFVSNDMSSSDDGEITFPKMMARPSISMVPDQYFHVEKPMNASSVTFSSPMSIVSNDSDHGEMPVYVTRSNLPETSIEKDISISTDFDVIESKHEAIIEEDLAKEIEPFNPQIDEESVSTTPIPIDVDKSVIAPLYAQIAEETESTTPITIDVVDKSMIAPINSQIDEESESTSTTPIPIDEVEKSVVAPFNSQLDEESESATPIPIDEVDNNATLNSNIDEESESRTPMPIDGIQIDEESESRTPMPINGNQIDEESESRTPMPIDGNQIDEESESRTPMPINGNQIDEESESRTPMPIDGNQIDEESESRTPMPIDGNQIDEESESRTPIKIDEVVKSVIGPFNFQLDEESESRTPIPIDEVDKSVIAPLYAKIDEESESRTPIMIDDVDKSVIAPINFQIDEESESRTPITIDEVEKSLIAPFISQLDEESESGTPIPIDEVEKSVITPFISQIDQESESRSPIPIDEVNATRNSQIDEESESRTLMPIDEVDKSVITPVNSQIDEESDSRTPITINEAEKSVIVNSQIDEESESTTPIPIYEVDNNATLNSNIDEESESRTPMPIDGVQIDEESESRTPMPIDGIQIDEKSESRTPIKIDEVEKSMIAPINSQIAEEAESRTTTPITIDEVDKPGITPLYAQIDEESESTTPIPIDEAEKAVIVNSQIDEKSESTTPIPIDEVKKSVVAPFNSQFDEESESGTPIPIDEVVKSVIGPFNFQLDEESESRAPIPIDEVVESVIGPFNSQLDEESDQNQMITPLYAQIDEESELTTPIPIDEAEKSVIGRSSPILTPTATKRATPDLDANKTTPLKKAKSDERESAAIEKPGPLKPKARLRAGKRISQYILPTVQEETIASGIVTRRRTTMVGAKSETTEETKESDRRKTIQIKQSNKSVTFSSPMSIVSNASDHGEMPVYVTRSNLPETSMKKDISISSDFDVIESKHEAIIVEDLAKEIEPFNPQIDEESVSTTPIPIDEVDKSMITPINSQIAEEAESRTTTPIPNDEAEKSVIGRSSPILTRSATKRARTPDLDANKTTPLKKAKSDERESAAIEKPGPPKPKARLRAGKRISQYILPTVQEETIASGIVTRRRSTMVGAKSEATEESDRRKTIQVKQSNKSTKKSPSKR